MSRHAGHATRRHAADSPPRGTSPSRGIGTRGLTLPRAIESTRTIGTDGRTGVVLGVDVGGTKVHAALADLTGHVLDESVQPTLGSDPGELAQQLRALVGTLTQARPSPLRAVAVGCPGVVDPVTGGVRLSPNAPAVEGNHLRSALETALGVPVDLDNDVNLAAAAEHWLGVARECDDFVLVNLGTGIGAGLVQAGDLYRGPRGGAGEIAHLPLDDAGLVPVTRLGAFEQVVWPRALGQRWSADPRAGAAPAPSPTQLLRLADEGHPVARDVLAEEARLLAAGVQVLVAVVDPGLVVLGGGLGRNPVLLDALEAALRDAALGVPLRPTGLDERGGALGAVLLAAGTAAVR